MDIVVAVYSDWGIGDGATQPVVLSADRARFRALTSGGAVIVGRKTLEDFPGGRPLKNRHNIVITRQNISIEGAEVVHSTEEALAAAARQERCAVIGGASVFRQLFPYADRAYVTKIACRPVSTAFFPNLDDDIAWQLAAQEPEAEENGIKYKFCTYIRVK